MAFSSFKKEQLLFENWRHYVKTEGKYDFPGASSADDLLPKMAKNPGAARALANAAPDRDALKHVLQGDYDGQADDDQAGVDSPKPMSVGALTPTQREIDLMQSVGYPLSDIGILETMIETGESTAPGHIAIAGNQIIDGHHRWSGVFSISGPAGKVSAENIRFPGSGTDQKLAAAQMAIAAYKPPNLGQPSEDEPFPTNIMGVGQSEIAGMIKSNIGKTGPGAPPGPLLNPGFVAAAAKSETVAKWAGFEVGAREEDVINNIAEKVASNLGEKFQKKANPEAPVRADMPQLDHDTMGDKAKVKDDIIGDLRDGAFNISEPFEPGLAEPVRRAEKSKQDEKE